MVHEKELTSRGTERKVNYTKWNDPNIKEAKQQALKDIISETPIIYKWNRYLRGYDNYDNVTQIINVNPKKLDLIFNKPIIIEIK